MKQARPELKQVFARNCLSRRTRARRRDKGDGHSGLAQVAQARHAPGLYGAHRVERGPMDDIILYDYFRSSACYRVRIALNLKGVPYTAVPTSLLVGEQRSAEFLSINPQGFVPALQVGDALVTQSFAIIDWIDHQFAGPALVPQDGAARARALAIAMAIGCDIHPLNNLRVLKYLTIDLGLREEVRDRWYRHWIEEGFTALEAMAQPHAGPFLAGAAPGLEDIFLVPQMANARRYDVDLAPFPALLACDEAARQHPAFAAAAPEMVKPVE
jgi:maleylacetoacetate isomerase